MTIYPFLSHALQRGCSVGELSANFLKELEKEKNLPVYDLYFGGSSVLALVCPGVKPRDVDLKMVFFSLGSEEKKREIFSRIRSVWERVVGSLPRTALGPTFCRGVKEAHANIRFPGQSGRASLDFSLRVYSDDKAVDYVTNADSLYLSVKEALEGGRTLFSKEGEIQEVLGDIQTKKLTSRIASRVQGGWGRVLCYLIGGWTIEDSSMLEMRGSDTLANLGRMALEKCSTPRERFFFWSNAVLHDPSEDLEKVVQDLYPEDWRPLPEGDIRLFLFLFLPLVAREVLDVTHLGVPFLQCCFEEGCVLVPKGCERGLAREELRGPFLALLVQDKDLRRRIVEEQDEKRAKALLLLCPTLSGEVLLSLLEEGIEVDKLTNEEKERVDVRGLALSLCKQSTSAYEGGFLLRPLLVGQKPKVICDVLQVMVERYGDTLKDAPPTFWEDIDSLITPDFPLKPRQRLLALLAKPLYGTREGKVYDLLSALIHSLGGQVGEGIEERMLDAVVRQDERALASLLKDGIDEKLLEGVERTLLDKALLILSENGYAKKAVEYKPSLLLCVKLYQKGKKKEGILGYVKDKIVELSSLELMTLYVGVKQVPELLLLVEERISQQESLGKLTEGQKRLFLERMPVLVEEGNAELVIRLLGLLPPSEGLEECLLLLLEKQETASLIARRLEPLLSFLFRLRMKGRDKRNWHKALLPVLEYLPVLRREGWNEYKKDKAMMEKEREVTRFYLSALSAEERFLFSLECFSYQDLFNQALLEEHIPLMESYGGWTEELLMGFFQSFIRTGRERQEVDRILLRKLPSYFSRGVESFFTKLKGPVDVDVLKQRVKEQVAKVKDKDPVQGILRFMVLHFYRLTGDLPKEFWQVARRYLDTSAKKNAIVDLREGLQEYLDRCEAIPSEGWELLLGFSPLFSPPLSFTRKLALLLDKADQAFLGEEIGEICHRIRAVCEANPSHQADVLDYLARHPFFLQAYGYLFPLEDYMDGLVSVANPPSSLLPPYVLVAYLCEQPRKTSLIGISERLIEYMKRQRKEGKIDEGVYARLLTRLVTRIHKPFLEELVRNEDLAMLSRQFALFLECVKKQKNPSYLGLEAVNAIGARCIEETENPSAKQLFTLFLEHSSFFCHSQEDVNNYIECLSFLSILYLVKFFSSPLSAQLKVGEETVVSLLNFSLCYRWKGEDALYAIRLFTIFIQCNPSFVKRLKNKSDPLSVVEWGVVAKAYALWNSPSDIPPLREGEPVGNSDRHITILGIMAVLSLLQGRIIQIGEALEPFDSTKLIDLLICTELSYVRKFLEELMRRGCLEQRMVALIRGRLDFFVHDVAKKREFMDFLVSLQTRI